ncbi:S-layer homology domain-containing protein [Alkaliphilus peptidifermentans]|uniref:CARDB protein n=1 Tax=Alkaliphilus peptidifermentans DSM 18978 TaxID=1120976 RepID=A0A1G5ADM7_9FIRM|nr:S-layer homology domain-containing protein [Alkaliphilus peptidifermentans]SCX75967.1 CARDB protein [Alkaliphilus peptidifermentans DSM 18978]
MGGKKWRSISFLLVFTLVLSSFFTFFDGHIVHAEAPQVFTETFDNLGVSGTNYVNGSFKGDNGITWHYTHVTGEQSYPIDGAGMLLRRSGDGSKIISDPIPGGIGNFSVDMRKAFTSTGDRQIEVFINNISIGQSIAFGSGSGADDTIHTFEVKDINITGNVVIEIRHITGGSSNRQLTIDNITWTSYSGTGGEVPPQAISISHTPVESTVAGSDIEINFTTKNEQGTVTAAVYYRPAGGSNYTIINPTGNFLAVIPGSEVTEDMEYYIIAQDDNNTARSPKAGTHEIKVETKVSDIIATPAAGAVEAGTKVELTTSTDGATIYYTTGDDEPNTVYTEKIEILEATTIKAKAVKAGLDDSITSTFSYTMKEDEVLSILEVKKLSENTSAIVSGVVTALSGNREAYIQDDVAGLQINISNINTKVKAGDFITVKGKVDEYNGEIQFVPDSLDDITIESSDNKLPEPLQVTIQDVDHTRGRVNVTTALANYLGNDRTTTVRGVITDKLPNKEFAIQIADTADPTKTIDVALPGGFRKDFSITLENNPAAEGRIVIVTGQEKDYFSKPAIRQVDKYDPNTGINTKGKYHVSFDVEGMLVTTEPFEVVGKDSNGFTAKSGDFETYIYTGRAANFNLVEIEVGDWYSATGVVAYFNRPQLKLENGADLKFEVPPGQQDPREPLVLDIKPGNFVSTFERSPLISARLERTEADIDYGNIRLLVNGLRVDHTLDQDNNRIYYQAENLPYGEHDVAIYVPDVEDRLKEFKWFFRVEKENPSYNFYYGIPHAHTAYSDGAGTPTQAFDYAKNNKLDWLFMSDHSNWLDGVSDGNFEFNASANEYIEVDGSQWYKTRKEAEAINAKYNGEFLAVRGFEMTSSIWGHTNTINSDTYVEAKKQMVPLREYYDWVVDVSTRSDANVFNMFNHPNWPDDSFNNLAYVPNLDRYFNGIEVANGAPPYSYSRAESHYWKSLDNGWRVGAMNGQDNHATNWGDPDNLTVVIAEKLDTNNIIDAMNARRMYSTETRTLELTVKGNGHWMGSVIDVSAGDDVNIEILAEDSKVSIDKLQLITNGGHILEEKVFDGGTNKAEWNLTVEASGGAQWFVIKVIHSNGAWGHASPIFTVAGENDVKLTGINVNPDPTLPGFETKIEATVTNMGVRGVEGIEVKFYEGSIHESNLIGTVELEDSLNAGSSKTLSATWLPQTHGEVRVYAVLTYIEGVTTVTEISKAVKVVKPIGKKILFDGAHNNADVPGTVVQIIEMLRLYGYEATINTQRYTPQLLDDVDVLIINIPLTKAASFTAAEEDAIADWVNAGGSIMLAGKSNHGQDSTLFNGLMEKMGSGIRFNDDNIYELEGSGKYSGYVWSIIMSNLPPTKSGLNANMDSIRIFSGASLINANGGPLVNNPASELEILLFANDTSYTANPGSKAHRYNLEGGLDGDTIPVIAKEKVGNGRIVAAGRHFYSDFEIGNDNSNTALTLQTIDWLANYDRIRTIKDVRDNANSGDIVTVRGIVTAPTDHFFDVIYIQDETSGLAVYGSQTKNNLPLGTEIIATGRVTYFEGELELAFETYDYEVMFVGPVGEIETTALSTNKAMSQDYAGMLITTEGVITDYNPIDGNFTINDGSGHALVQIDGYLGLGMERFTIGDRVSVTGISSYGSKGPRIRVRYYSDLSFADASTFTLTSVSKVAVNTQFNITINNAKDKDNNLLQGPTTVTTEVGSEKIVDTYDFINGKVSIPWTFDTTGEKLLKVTVDGVTESKTLIVTVLAAKVITFTEDQYDENGKATVDLGDITEDTIVIVTYAKGEGENRVEVPISITVPSGSSSLSISNVEKTNKNLVLQLEVGGLNGRKVTLKLPIPEDVSTERAGGFHKNGDMWEFRSVIGVDADAREVEFETDLSAIAVAELVDVPTLNTAAINQNKVTLSWNLVNGATFELIRKAGASETVIQVENNQYIDTVSYNSTYEYQVRAVKDGYHSDLSNNVLATTGTAPSSGSSERERDENSGSTPSTGGSGSTPSTGSTKQPPVSSTEEVIETEVIDEEPAREIKVNLTDIAGHWAEDYIKELVALGAIGGYSDGTFRPENNITRAEFVKIIVEAFKLEAKVGKVFEDTKDHWAKDYIATAQAHGIINGYNDTTFGPNDFITREQMVLIVIRAAKLDIVSGENKFTDSEAISSWAKDVIYTANINGIVGGYPDNSFKPQGNTKRAEAAKVIIEALRKMK